MVHLPGMVLRDHWFPVPLDYARPDGPTITVYAREVVAAGREYDTLPWLVYLQGGPGGKSPRPPANAGWLPRALREYRVLLLDQRGTGLSTPATRQTLTQLGSSTAQAEYLSYFRADSIVRDAEHIRRTLQGDQPWSILGQSFGGFCAATYLSLAPEGLHEAIITGGLPPLSGGPDLVYRATYQRVHTQNERYFARYPGDQALTQRIVAHLQAHEVALPDGSQLTPRRFLALGHGFGATGGFESVHYLLEEAFVDGPQGELLSDTFLHGVLGAISYATNPLYAVLHEAIYCQHEASRWSAERVLAEYPEFAIRPGQPLFFTGEMIYPWMFEHDPALQPLQAAAELLAQKDDWPVLYDAAQLQRNSVPVAAAIYYDDMYVERAFSEETARTIAGSRVWVTNEYEHNGLRMSGEKVLGRLLDLLHGIA